MPIRDATPPVAVAAARSGRDPDRAWGEQDVTDADGAVVGTVRFELTDDRRLKVLWSGVELVGFQAWSKEA